MSQQASELRKILDDVRGRLTRRSLLRGFALGAIASATVVAAGVGATFLVARDGLPLVVTTAVVAFAAAFAFGGAVWPCGRQPTDAQLARFIEEQHAGLDDVVVTAADYAARPDVSPRMRDVLARDAARALSTLNRDAIVSRESMRRAAVRAALAAVPLATTVALFAPAMFRATNVASAYLFPARVNVEVFPGTTKIRAGQPLTITARIRGLVGELVPTLTVAVGDETRTLRMTPGGEPGVFSMTIDAVTTSFAYSVSAAKTRSGTYTISVIRPPRVERIDVHYDFPPGLGMEPRTDEDSGDIYGPAGTRVRLAITADKPIARAFLVLNDGSKLALNGQAQLLDGELTIDEDGSYRVALADEDGLENAGDTEYFIRTVADRPPDVRILRPASDKHVTPLEEVQIEARADDDYGIVSFDLVFQTPAGKERTVPLRGARGGLTASGLHTLFMEDLGVQPGDFVTYYARARDVNRGRRSAEARSDIFFLEVKPFEEEFVAAQSQAMGQGAGMQGQTGLEGLAEAQKQIIVATWKLDARARRARDAGSQRDIKAVAKAQSELRTRAEQANGQVSRAAGDPRRRRPGQSAPPGDDPLGRAVEAMGRAANELDQFSTSSALPHEMEALNQLLKADAEIRRRQVTRQQQAGGGGGMNRAQADLSSLFDRELRRRQETNYETPNSTESREETKQDDPLERIRELARRQDALNREQRELMRNHEQIEQEELKRQLERLTREQNELRQQAEQLAQRMQLRRSGQESQSSQSNGESGGGQGQQSRQLRQISEDMRNAATGMRRQDSEQATDSGKRAADRLRELERQMQTASPNDRRRALGDLQLETRQLADSERRLANEASRTAHGQSGDDARRRLAGEQDRLADRAERLRQRVTEMSRAGQGEADERRAMTEAARELEKQRLADRMRESAESLRQPSARDGQPSARDTSRDAARQGEDFARALDQIADRLGAAAGRQDADSRRLSDQLERTQDMRAKMESLERAVEELRRESEAAERSDAQKRAGQPDSQSGQNSQDRQGGQQTPQGGQQGHSQGSQQAANGSEGGGGQQGGNAGGNGGRLQQLQREVNERMRDAERLADEIRHESPGMQANLDAAWWRSFSAPGTEAFKQDFARWESLKKNLLVALEDVESRVSGDLRTHETKERLNAGGHEAVSPAYREAVDKYYRSLASPRKPQ